MPDDTFTRTAGEALIGMFHAADESQHPQVSTMLGGVRPNRMYRVTVERCEPTEGDVYAALGAHAFREHIRNA